MPASAIAMSTKMAALEELIKEGEYDTPFGRVLITRTDSGYRVVISINEREIGRNMARQLIYSLVGPYLRREQIA
jgi:hypothetical protein